MKKDHEKIRKDSRCPKGPKKKKYLSLKMSIEKLSLAEMANTTFSKRALSDYIKKSPELKNFSKSPNEGLEFAVDFSYPFLVTYYLSQKANPEYLIYNGITKSKTFLEKALDKEDTKIIEALINYQTPEERKDTLYGLRELLNTIDYNNLKHMEMLLKAGINPDQQSLDRRIPLHSASYLGNVAAVDLLLKYGASVDLADSNGVTPLMLASGKENLEVVKRLLQSGANPEYVDDTDLSSIDIANKVKNNELLKLLKKEAAATTGASVTKGTGSAVTNGGANGAVTNGSNSSERGTGSAKSTRKRSPKKIDRLSKSTLS